MKKAKLIKQTKKLEFEPQESYSLKKFLLIILVLVIILGIFYIITVFVAKPSNNNSSNLLTVIDNQIITFNHILDRKENEYYVLAHRTSKSGAYSHANYQELYNKYISDYSKNDESFKFYKVNLDDALNKKYLGKETVIEDDIENLKVSDEVLFKIKSGKIENAFVGSEEILKELSNL